MTAITLGEGEVKILIRPATLVDLPFLPKIERASDQFFLTCNMSLIANLPASPPEAYRSIVEKEHVWVVDLPPAITHKATGDVLASSTDSLGQPPVKFAAEPVAFISIKIFDNELEGEEEDGVDQRTVFINQVSVDLKFGRKGLGKSLIQHIEIWAAAEGFKALDLTTFADVPFNRPYYERLGYRVLTPDELKCPSARNLRRTLKDERKDIILGKWDRVGMRKILVRSG
ncbi:hypothetical protein BKA66DRAFT_55064 [Pyrenochaeta sp. MPI-SDFR-AT-0127]|nr:hypothetical protein BKA66DRAFT_55064 [Pyrenochaeta sp. MPI-SDFR-AT-0127]